MLSLPLLSHRFISVTSKQSLGFSALDSYGYSAQDRTLWDFTETTACSRRLWLLPSSEGVSPLSAHSCQFQGKSHLPSPEGKLLSLSPRPPLYSFSLHCPTSWLTPSVNKSHFSPSDLANSIKNSIPFPSLSLPNFLNDLNRLLPLSYLQKLHSQSFVSSYYSPWLFCNV